jgi:nicotinamidase-related amidase
MKIVDLSRGIQSWHGGRMALELDVTKTAVILIDLEGPIVGRELAPYSGAEVVAKGRKLADAVRAKGGMVVFVHVLLHDIVSLPVDAPMQRPLQPPPLEASDVVPEAGMQPGDVLIAKRQWGAFYGTGLEQQLDRRGIETVILAGIATNMGVESTARGAQDRGYAVVFAEDAMSTMSKEWHEFAVKNLFPRIGRVRSVAEIVEAL